MARKKKQHHEEHIDETWLIPYSDLLTLLLALFIVLFASSEIDVKKFDQLVRSLNVAFNGGLSVFEHPSPTPIPQEIAQQSLKQNQETTEQEKKEQEKFQEKYKQETQELQALQKNLDGYIGKNNLQDKLQTKLTDRGLLITILDNALFASGSAEVRQDARKLAQEIANLLVTNPPREVTVSGHTDNVPINRREFPSNWNLSAARASNFVNVLLENKKLDPKKFSVMGYGEFRPIATNATEAGRAKNRRVEVMILRNNVRANDK
jgi:chemotaxis protein MotB